MTVLSRGKVSGWLVEPNGDLHENVAAVVDRKKLKSVDWGEPKMPGFYEFVVDEFKFVFIYNGICDGEGKLHQVSFEQDV